MPSFSSLEENLGWQSRVPDYYLSDPDMPPPGWHDYEPASSVQLHAESGSEPDIWSAPWWLYPPVIIHSSVYSTVKYVIIHRIVYSTVKYNACDSFNLKIKLLSQTLISWIQPNTARSSYQYFCHMKKTVQKTITNIFISVKIDQYS